MKKVFDKDQCGITDHGYVHYRIWCSFGTGLYEQ